jgi:hypothetical protein
MTEFLNMTPTYLAALSGAAFLLLGFLTPTRFAGVEVQWTHVKAIGCFFAGLILLSYAILSQVITKVLVDQSVIAQLISDAQKAIDSINSARAGNSYPYCSDHAGAGLPPLNDTLAILKKLGTTK